MERIDAHVHLWWIDAYDSSWMEGPFAVLRRDFGVADLEAELTASGIDGAVFVQAQHAQADNDLVLRLADQHPAIRGVVGWVDLTAADVEQTVDRYRSDRRFVGVRHLTHDEADDDWLLRPDVQRGLAVLQAHGVPFDLLLRPQHLARAAAVADRFPNLPLVLDHLGKPRIRDGALDDWLPGFRELSRRDNVFCKLSGMVTEADLARWTPADLAPYVARALDAFGPDRLMFGSDWPVCTVAGADQARVLETLERTLAALSAPERAAILGGTCKRVYRLPS